MADEFDMELSGNRVYEKYYETLLKAEDSASKKGIGTWKVEESDKRKKVPFWKKIASKFGTS